jgi:transposase
MMPVTTGRPAYHPATPEDLPHGYLNRLQSRGQLEREAQRNIELM